jgi:glycerophosphoryl diester phosphodiesterase
MLIIGHRGAAGTAPENTIEAMQAGLEAGADILEFDVRVTRDKIPILSHGARQHGKIIRLTNLADLQKAGTVTLLESVLTTFFGKVLLNLEIKPGTDVTIICHAIEKYIATDEDWNAILISSFHVRDLSKLRRQSKNINLALLHAINPLAFVAYQRRLRLTAVGWHRLHVNSLATQIAQKAGIFTYVYTINRPEAAYKLAKKGIDGVVTDHPEKFVSK